MANAELLKKHIREKRLYIQEIADALNVTKPTVYARLEDGKWTIDQVDALTHLLKLNKRERDKIFFA